MFVLGLRMEKLLLRKNALVMICEHQMVLNECGRNVIVLDEDDFWEQTGNDC